jgi:hypothetical protein
MIHSPRHIRLQFSAMTQSAVDIKSFPLRCFMMRRTSTPCTYSLLSASEERLYNLENSWPVSSLTFPASDDSTWPCAGPRPGWLRTIRHCIARKREKPSISPPTASCRSTPSKIKPPCWICSSMRQSLKRVSCGNTITSHNGAK